MAILTATPEVTKATLDEWRRAHIAGTTATWPLDPPAWVVETEVLNDDDSIVVTYQGVKHTSGEFIARVIATFIVYLDVTDDDVFYVNLHPRVEFSTPPNSPTADMVEAFQFAAVLQSAATQLMQIVEGDNL